LTPIGLETIRVESKFGKGNNKLKELLKRKRFEKFDLNLNSYALGFLQKKSTEYLSS